MTVKFVKLRNTAQIPTKGSSQAAGYDLYACEGTYIMPGQTRLIPTGLSIQPPEGYCAKIYARSGLASKKGLRPANCVGICDEDYTGEYMVALHNDSDQMQVIEDGERIAQLMFERYYSVEFEEVEQLKTTERGSGGFGSTGTN
jgi:dUTP pyrophosphatase